MPVAGSTGLPVSGSNFVVLADFACGRTDWLCRSVGRTFTREWSSCSGVERKSCGPCRLGTVPCLRIDRSSGLWVVVRWDWLALLVKLSSGRRIELSCSLDRLFGLRVDWGTWLLGRLGGDSGGRIDWPAGLRGSNAFGTGLPVSGLIGCPVFGSKTPGKMSLVFGL